MAMIQIMGTNCGGFETGSLKTENELNVYSNVKVNHG